MAAGAGLLGGDGLQAVVGVRVGIGEAWRWLESPVISVGAVRQGRGKTSDGVAADSAADEAWVCGEDIDAEGMGGCRGWSGLIRRVRLRGLEMNRWCWHSGRGFRCLWGRTGMRRGWWRRRRFPGERTAVYVLDAGSSTGGWGGCDGRGAAGRSGGFGGPAAAGGESAGVAGGAEATRM